MKYAKWTFIILLQLILINCSKHEHLTNTEFVTKYGNTDFSEFKNTFIHYRSTGERGGSIFMASDKDNNGLYVITVSGSKKHIINTSSHLLKDSTKTDRVRLEALTLKLCKYPMPLLGVDCNNNVKVNLMPNAPFNLIRFSSLKFKTAEYSSWRKVRGNWYEKPD